MSQAPTIIVNADVMRAIAKQKLEEKDDPSKLRAVVAQAIAEAAEHGDYCTQVETTLATGRPKPIATVMSELRTAGYEVEKIFGVLHISWNPTPEAVPSDPKEG
jgi:hypothetical protein